MVKQRANGYADWAYESYNVYTGGWGNRDPKSNPKLLTGFTHKGVYFGQCHVDFAPQLRAFLDALHLHVKGGWRKGKCGILNFGSTLPDGSRSQHTFGKAADINWDCNPIGMNIEPPTQGATGVLPRSITIKLCAFFGLDWGGTWTGGYRDYMHVESHLPADVARSVRPKLVSAVKNTITRNSPWPTKQIKGGVFGNIDGPARQRGGANDWEKPYVMTIWQQLVVKQPHDGAFVHEKDVPASYRSAEFGPKLIAGVKAWQLYTGQKVTGEINRVGWFRVTHGGKSKKRKPGSLK